MNYNSILITSLLTVGLAIMAGTTLNSAAALPNNMNSYSHPETEKGFHHGMWDYYGHGVVHNMFGDCYYSKDYWHGHDDDKKSMYTNGDYNHTHNYDERDWHDDDVIGMPFMKDYMMSSMKGHGIIPFHMMMFSAPFLSDYSQDPDTITAMGVATASVEPERVVITMGVETTRLTASAALDENSRLLNAAVDSIVAEGVSLDSIATSRISIHPEYDGYYDDDGQYREDFDGYTVRNIIKVSTDQIDMTAAILDSAVQAGANSVESVRFTVSDDARMTINESLIEPAVLNAKHQAHLALKPLNYDIVGVKDVVILPSGTASPLMRLSADFEAFASTTQIFTPDEDLSVTAVVTFLIGPDYTHCHK